MNEFDRDALLTKGLEALLRLDKNYDVSKNGSIFMLSMLTGVAESDIDAMLDKMARGEA